jgi:AcrR family transcriptional regulator
MAEQQARILAAAADVFAESGFAGARVDAIARRARLNKRLLYHYVGNKAALLEAVLERAAQGLSPAALEDRRFWRLLIVEQEQLGHGPLGQALASLAAADRDPEGLRGAPSLGARMLGCLLPELVTALAARPAGVLEPAKPRLRLTPQVRGVRSRSKRSK